jgi:phage gpG-like protein
MTGVFTVLGFVAKLKAIEHDMDALGPAIIRKACEMVAEEARRVIGEGYDYWPALKPETLARKMMNTPLLETGELRASIEWTSSGLEGAVGSNNDKAVWHELGTARIPPRSFLMGAAIEMEPQIHVLFKRAVIAVIAGRGLHSSELGELLHFLHVAKHIGHKVDEAVNKAIDYGSE